MSDSNFSPFSSSNPSPSFVKTGDKERVLTALLALFLGGLGVHRFYLGQIGMGFLYLLFCWTFIPAIAAFIEFIIFLVMSDDDFDLKYNWKTVLR